MLLVAALGLAVAFVALALVLNAVVFTENLATRNPDPADDALAYEGAVTEGVGGLLAETNRHNDTDYATLESTLQDGIVAWDRNASRLVAADGTLASVELNDTTRGTRIVQNSSSEFTANGSGDSPWTLAGNVSDIRRFVVVANPGSTSPVSFNISDDDNDYWRVDIEKATGGGTNVTVVDDGSVVANETHPNATVVVDLTEGAVNESAVENWTFAAGVDAPSTINVTGGTRATGRYQVFVDEEYDDLATEAPTPTSAIRPAIYSATVDVTVHRSSVTYESPVVLAPEDAPGNDTLAQ